MRRGAYLDIVLISRLALELAHRLVPLGLWRRRRRGGRRVSTHRDSRRFVKGPQHSQSPRSAPADAAATAQGRRPRARGSLRACETARLTLGSGRARHRPGCCTAIGSRPSAARRRHHSEHSRPRGPRAGTRRDVRPAPAAEARARPARARTCCWRNVGQGFLAYLAALMGGAERLCLQRDAGRADAVLFWLRVKTRRDAGRRYLGPRRRQAVAIDI